MKVLFFLYLFLGAASIDAKLYKMTVGPVSLQVELARTPLETQKGLSFRPYLPNNRGMLFVFEKEQKLSFWMKDTYIPLSIGFFDKNKILVDIQKMSVVSGRQIAKTHVSLLPSKYALEVNQGWFQEHKVQIGDSFDIPGLDLLKE